MVRYYVIFYGQVQGVGFRYTLAKMATNYGITGWVPREYRRAMNNLTTDAIREATDNLPMGMCYEDPSGRIVLCNDTMHRIGFALTGKDLQTGEELLEGLKNPPASCKKLSEGYIKLPEGEIYEFIIKR